jgi:hypothetical protein
MRLLGCWGRKGARQRMVEWLGRAGSAGSVGQLRGARGQGERAPA